MQVSKGQSFHKEKADPLKKVRLFYLSSSLFCLVLLGGCSSLTTTRPAQEMNDTLAALQAAKEVKADELSPHYYREAREWFFKARREYKFKNFKEAKEFLRKSQLLAEQAEFEAIRAGATRASIAPPDPKLEAAQQPVDKSKDAGYKDPNPQAKSVDEYQEEKTQRERGSSTPPAGTPSTTTHTPTLPSSSKP